MNKTVKIELTEREVKDLRLIRNYFGASDTTMFEHLAFEVMNNLVKKMNVMQCSADLFCDDCDGVNKKDTWVDKSNFSCKCKDKAK